MFQSSAVLRVQRFPRKAPAFASRTTWVVKKPAYALPAASGLSAVIRKRAMRVLPRERGYGATMLRADRRFSNLVQSTLCWHASRHVNVDIAQVLPAPCFAGTLQQDSR